MKKITFLTIALLVVLLIQQSHGQYSRNDIFNRPEITWFGFDFSKIKLIGPAGFTDVSTIKDVYFMEINNLVRMEPEKYDLRAAFHKVKVNLDLSVIKERNKAIDVTKLVLDDFEDYEIERSQVDQIVSQYKAEVKEGIGVVFIMEKFVKLDEAGYMWVVFFDISSKEVLQAEKMTGKTGGFGWRNYWARTCYNVLKEIEKTRYNEWLME